MKILIVGGAGYVGSILRPALEAHHECHYFDLRPIPGAEERSTVGDITDPDAVRRAVYKIDSVVFLAMGARREANGWNNAFVPELAFKVNVQGHHNVLFHAFQEGVRHVVYASTLSVYANLSDNPHGYVDENLTPDAMHVYGVTKRLAEGLNDALVAQHPEAAIFSLRLMWPRNDEDWPGNEHKPGVRWCPTGPNDLRRCFLAALDRRTPGHHAIQITGDLDDHYFPTLRAQQILGWKPEGN